MIYFLLSIKLVAEHIPPEVPPHRRYMMKQVSFDSPPLAATQLASKSKHDNHDQGTSNMTETDTEYYDKTEEEVDSLPSEEGQIR